MPAKFKRDPLFQGARATAAGEECISNIRTVRAFAMEDIEMEMYNSEVEKSTRSYEQLGTQIYV